MKTRQLLKSHIKTRTNSYRGFLNSFCRLQTNMAKGGDALLDLDRP